MIESPISKPQQKRSRTKTLAIMLSIILTGLGYYSAIDYPQAMAEPLIEALAITSKDIANLYTIYSLVSLIAVPMGGVTVNYLGNANAGIIIGISQVVSAIAAYLSIRAESYTGVLISRAVFSLCGGTYFVVQPTALAKFFSGGYLSLAVGVGNTFNTLFGGMSNYLIPCIYLRFKGLCQPFIFIICASSLGLIGFLIFSVLDRSENKIREVAQDGARGDNKRETQEKEYEFKLSDLSKMGSLFWIMVIGYGFVINTQLQINTVMTEMAMNRFGYSFEEAKNSLSILQAANLITLPLFSIIAQRFSRKVLGLAVSIALAMANFTLMLILPTNKPKAFYICLVLHGIFCGMSSSYYMPSLILSIPKEVTSIGFAVASLMFNSLFIVVSFSIGNITVEQTPEEYQLVLYIFLSLSVISFLLILAAFRLDRKIGGVLSHCETSQEVKDARDSIQRSFMGEDISLDGEYYDDHYDSFTSTGV